MFYNPSRLTRLRTRATAIGAAVVTLVSGVAGSAAAFTGTYPGDGHQTGSNIVPLTMIWDGTDGERTVDFNLFGAGGQGAVAPIVPGDSDQKVLSVTSHATNPYAAYMTVDIIDVRLRNDAAAWETINGERVRVYDRLLVNDTPVSKIAAFANDPANRAAGVGWPVAIPAWDGVLGVEGIYGAPLAPGGAPQLVPFNWYLPADLTYGNIGVMPAFTGETLGVEFTVRVRLSGEFPALLTVFTSVEGPDHTISPLFERTDLAAATEFSGTVVALTDDGEFGSGPDATAEPQAWVNGQFGPMVVTPGQPYLVTTFFDNLDYSPEVAAVYALNTPGALAGDSLAAPAAALVSSETAAGNVGALSCFAVDWLDPVSVDASGSASWNYVIVPGWDATNGLSGYVSVPLGYHVVCEQTASTALLSVRKIVLDLVEGIPVLADPTVTAQWMVRITALGDLPGVEWEFEFPHLGNDFGATVDAASATMTGRGAPEFIKVRPGVEYLVEVLAPAEIVELFNLAGHFVQSSVPSEGRPGGVPDGVHRDSTEQDLLNFLAPSFEASGLGGTPEFLPTVPFIVQNVNVLQPSEALPNEAAVSRQMVPVPGATWRGSLAAGEALEVTWVSLATEAPLVEFRPGEEIIVHVPEPPPFFPVFVYQLAQTGADLLPIIGAIAVLGLATWLLLRNRRRNQAVGQ